MSDLQRVGEQMCRQIQDFVIPLQTEKDIREHAFEMLDKTSRQWAFLLKGSQAIPRAPFKELYSAARVLEAEAPYTGNPSLVLQMASALHMTADLIIWGECHEDRVPGVPRVR